MPPTSAAGWNTDQMPGLPEPGIARVRRSCQQRVPGHPRGRVRVECDAGPRHLTIAGYRPPWRPGADSEWTRFPVTRLRYTRPPGPSRFTGGTVTCASTSLTSSSHHQTSATCCARSTATRSRSSGDSPSRLRRPHSAGTLLCRYQPGPVQVITLKGLPGTLFPGDMNSSGISWTAPDHPGNPAAATTPWLWLTCL